MTRAFPNEMSFSAVVKEGIRLVEIRNVLGVFKARS